MQESAPAMRVQSVLTEEAKGEGREGGRKEGGGSFMSRVAVIGAIGVNTMLFD